MSFTQLSFNNVNPQSTQIYSPTRLSYNNNTLNTIKTLSSEKILVDAYGVSKAGDLLSKVKIPRRKLTDYDVGVKIWYCGICHSDKHHRDNDWGDSKYNPLLVPGHEIIGQVVDIGLEVDKNKIKIGDMVAIGNMTDSCQVCKNCEKSWEQYCLNDGPTWVYNSNERLTPDGKGRTLKPEDGLLGKPANDPTYGGYSSYIVAQEKFVLKLPTKLTTSRDLLAASAPLLCAGITVFDPFKLHKIGKGHKVAIAGIGGLGHLAIKFAKALGAEVVGLTTHADKLEDIKALGANDAVLMEYVSKADKKNFIPISLGNELKLKMFQEQPQRIAEGKEFPDKVDTILCVSDPVQKEKYYGYFDFILSTIPVAHDVTPYLELLHPGQSKLHIVGNMNEVLDLKGLKFVFEGKNITSSNVGGLQHTKEMLEFCADNQITADVTVVDITEVNKRMEEMVNGQAQYRYVIDLTSF
jgi:uncharacterized zinc-type alcohol dehydrogenase-like protein